jgi:hypothetical protein
MELQEQTGQSTITVESSIPLSIIEKIDRKA